MSNPKAPPQGEVSPRTEAKQQKLPTYLAEGPCKKCGADPVKRRTDNCRCINCARLAAKAAKDDREITGNNQAITKAITSSFLDYGS